LAQALNPLPDQIARDVSAALAEDIGDGDCTAVLVAESTLFESRVICRQVAVLAGSAWFDNTFAQLDRNIEVYWQVEDGEQMSADQEICRLQGPARGILSGERTALNFLQTLSSTATIARQYVEAIAHTKSVILDTRKTIPGLRLAQKYAVRCGGGSNHRIGLFDAILIKENHIAAMGSVSAAIHQARKLYPDLLLEVEVENLAQLQEACLAKADRVLLDNFELSDLQKAVEQFASEIDLEASGGVTLSSVKNIAETGVNYISTGDLTKNVLAVDFSMRYL
jgi:nicotinate-nucleotide pyrophosphorylase (carboxylating)